MEQMEQIRNNEVLNLIKPYLKDKKAYIVGGFIRDILMNKVSHDIDLIICDNDIENFSKELADKINAHFIELDKENSIYRLVLEDKINYNVTPSYEVENKSFCHPELVSGSDQLETEYKTGKMLKQVQHDILENCTTRYRLKTINYIDITKPIEDDFEKDILRRDLTINAIAYDINEEKIIDLTNGIEDIKNKIIKGISDRNFEDDPLRLLRIFRFAAKTGFDIAPELIELTKKLSPSIKKSAKERINTELMKMFEGGYTDTALLKMDETGLLTGILPIYKEIKKIPPNTHHHLDLLHHLIETVKQIQILYENSDEKVKNHLENCDFGCENRLAHLKFAGFLHDIGKPSCWTIEEDTLRHRFIKHDEIGAKLCVPILRDLKFSKKQIEYIKTLIKYHIYPSSMVSSPDVNDKAYLRFYRKMEGIVIDVILLAMADRLSARGEKVTEKMVENNINSLTNLLNNYFKVQEELKPLPKLLDGYDIMEILHIKQSPKLGEIINALKEAQINGEVNTKDEAVEFIRTFL